MTKCFVLMAASSPSAMSFLAPNVEGRNANLASGNVEIVVNGAIPIECRGKGSWLGKPLRSLVNEIFRHARVECSAQPSGSVGEQGRLGRTVTESKADVVETVALFEIGFTGLLKGDRVRCREYGQRLEPLWMGSQAPTQPCRPNRERPYGKTARRRRRRF